MEIQAQFFIIDSFQNGLSQGLDWIPLDVEIKKEEELSNYQIKLR